MFERDYAKNNVDVVVIPTVEVDAIDFSKEYDSPIEGQIRLYMKHAEVWLLEDLV
jgi:hypothetical protein